MQIGQALLVDIFLDSGDADIVEIDKAEHVRAIGPFG